MVDTVTLTEALAALTGTVAIGTDLTVEGDIEASGAVNADSEISSNDIVYSSGLYVSGGSSKLQGILLAGDTIYSPQPAPTAKTANATLTIAELLTNLITVTSATAVALTLPTGTDTDAGIVGGALDEDKAFEWVILNLGSVSGVVTLVAGTDHTIVGPATLAILAAARFRTRKTATNTFVTYRIG